jgi:hypothetical protein
MPVKTLKICDICEESIIYDSKKHNWWDNGVGGKFTVKEDGFNPGHDWAWEVLCMSCRKKMLAALGDCIKEIKKNKKTFI